MRLKPADRKQQILFAALTLAKAQGGWSKLTRKGVAEEAECAEALVSRYFGTMVKFKRAIMRSAIQHECLEIIAQGLACNDKYASASPLSLRTRALATLI